MFKGVFFDTPFNLTLVILHIIKIKMCIRDRSIAVQRKGAQPSIPYLKEVKEVYGDY